MPLTLQMIHSNIDDDYSEDEIKRTLLDLIAAQRITKDEMTQGFQISGDYPL